MIAGARSRLTPGFALFSALVLCVAGCGGATPSLAPPGAVAPTAVARYQPAQDLGPLFHDAQMAPLFPDSKTLVDARALGAPSAIVARYAAEQGRAGFSVLAFVQRHFALPRAAGEGFHTDTTRSMEEHIRALWPALIRPADAPTPYSSLIPLPNPYVVPGGRFREVYYWDSYFTMLGLVESGRTDLVRSMLDNFAHLIGTIGHIPNGNRTYYLGRSQPPYFAAMVGLYARAADSTQALRYLDALEAEHAFWMEGANRLARGAAHRRVVKLGDGTVLNRYFDDILEPRPESYREDYTLAQTVPAARRMDLYRNLRASAESGWDFSSRWMRDTTDLRTLETIELLPVDLNSLLYHAERTIAALRRLRGRAGDEEAAERFSAAAAGRRRALLAAAYDPAHGFFYDVRWRTGERVTDRPTLAAAAALYFGLATPAQARVVAARLERDFLKPGGFVTTLIVSGQQWDAPNGWPPLQWLAIEGVGRYGRGDLAGHARERWLALNRRTYQSTGKMTEKYDVMDLNRRAGGGEYPAQDGFGWSNGVALALAAQERPVEVGAVNPAKHAGGCLDLSLVTRAPLRPAPWTPTCRGQEQSRLTKRGSPAGTPSQPASRPAPPAPPMPHGSPRVGTSRGHHAASPAALVNTSSDR
ncbi:MAG: alpha,alpha-trehalase TreF [Gemmatimonadota bacterium]|nr:alpha,alpha-trehalase TreF [Gemmatimonadota bacterium]